MNSTQTNTLVLKDQVVAYLPLNICINAQGLVRSGDDILQLEHQISNKTQLGLREHDQRHKDTCML